MFRCRFSFLVVVLKCLVMRWVRVVVLVFW